MMLHALARNWWLILLRGIGGILFGVLTFIWPGIRRHDEAGHDEHGHRRYLDQQPHQAASRAPYRVVVPGQPGGWCASGLGCKPFGRGFGFCVAEWHSCYLQRLRCIGERTLHRLELTHIREICIGDLNANLSGTGSVSVDCASAT